MACETSNSEMEKFLAGPLVTWFSSCLDDSAAQNVSYEEIVDGVLIHKVFLQMDLYGRSNDVSPPKNDPTKRYNNLATIMRNLRQVYEDDLGQVILRLPDIWALAKEPNLHFREAELLLCLLLGCAIQCPQKKRFIDEILKLDEDTQASIMVHTQQIIQTPDIVLSLEMMINNVEVKNSEELEQQEKHRNNIERAFEYLRSINRERNEYKDKLVRCGIPLNNDEEDSDEAMEEGIMDSGCWMNEAKKRDAELSEWKAKVRKLKEREDEMSEELHDLKVRIGKLQDENEKLVLEARAAKTYRDELDAVAEKASKAEGLELELTRFKEKLIDLEFYKGRVDELVRDINLLTETKEVLDDKLNAYKFKDETIRELKAQVFELKHQINDLNLDKAAARKECMEIREQNAELERKLKSSTKDPLAASFIDESDESYNSINNNSISEQLSNSVHSQALKLELENRRLSNVVDALKENSFHENSFKILDLEKEKKRLSLLVGSLSENLEKMSKRNEEYESICRKLSEDNGKLRSNGSRFLELEQKLSNVNDEKLHLQRNLEDAYRKLEQKKNMKDAANEMRHKQEEVESRITALENEKNRALKEVKIQKELVKEKLNSLEISSKIIQELQIKLQKMEKQINLPVPVRRCDDPNIRKLIRRSFEDKDLQIEHTQLREDFGILMLEFGRFQTRFGEIQKLNEEYEAEFKEKNERIIELDIVVAKQKHRIDVLNRMIDSLKQDKKYFMDYMSQMLKQNHDLITQAIEDKEHYHNEEKKNTDLVNNLSRQKEKLEEKIMDHYRRMDNHHHHVKKRSAAASIKNTFVKVRRAGSEFFGRSRRSWAEDTSAPASERSHDFEFTRASNISMFPDDSEDRTPRPSDYSCLRNPRNRKSVDFLEDFTPENFSFEENRNSQDITTEL